MQTDRNKLCFIMNINNDLFFQECLCYLERLQVPLNMQIEVLEIRDAVSMAAGYNEGMRASDAKYKVYLHQDLFIINPNFIQDIIDIFTENPQIGLLGLVGTPVLAPDAVMWHGERVGLGREQTEYQQHSYGTDHAGYETVQAVDGLLMATQYDIEWREDLFTGWDFYDISQCFEMKRRGYSTVVPKQKNKWYVHVTVLMSLWKYNTYRHLLLEEYAREMKQ